MHTNIAFHRWLLAHPEFAAGRLSTRFLEDHFTPAALDPRPESADVALIAAALHAHAQRLRVTLPDLNGEARSCWRWAERRRSGRARA